MPLGLVALTGLGAVLVGCAPFHSTAPANIGMNLAGPADWSSELPFTDVFRLSREWISQRKGAGWGQGPKLERDANGWVKRLEPDCFAETVLCTIAGGHYPAGEYVCLYDGKGRIEFGNVRKEVSRAPGRIVFEPEPKNGSIFLRLMETDPADPVRNIRVLMPGYEKRYRQEPFTPWTLTRWKGCTTFRFMDWMLTNNSNQRDWADRPTPAYCNTTEKGVPIETMVELCNRTQANPWFCMPHLATDDYVKRFAELVRKTLDPKLKVYVELSNEVWNGGFRQHHDCAREGVRLGLGEAAKPWEASHRYYARRSQQVWRIWSEVFGGTSRLVRVLGSQAANAWWAEQDLTFEDTHKQCDALAIAPYCSFNIAPDGNPGSATVASWTVEQVMDHLERKSLPECTDWMRANKAVADRFKVRLICYEAGQHAVGVAGGENNEALTRVLNAANRSERMGKLYERYLDAWRDVGGGDLCCIFSSIGGFSKWGSWGLLEHYEDDTPKFRAVKSRLQGG
jgi:hypothetical protein